jgi:hypothetical protein
MSGVDLDKCTMITNFGTHNLQLFDKLARVSHNFNTWQVQLTIGNDLQLDYDDIVLLLNKIQEKKEQGLSIVVADNLNCGNCYAGIRACGVTAFGEVIPCLSMRAWTKDLKVQGNLLETSFEDIWVNGFTQYRNRTLGQLCCKDVTKIKEVEQIRKNIDACSKDDKQDAEEDVFAKYKEMEKNKEKEKTPKNVREDVFMYGVVREDIPSWRDNITVVYGVSLNNQVMSTSENMSLFNKLANKVKTTLNISNKEDDSSK